MKIEIKHRFSGAVLFAIETDSMRLAVEAAVKSGAYLGGANLGGADLGGANLGGANLGGADLRGAKWTKDVIINLAPIFIGNLAWDVWILDDHMQIGCKFHSLKDWASFDDRRIAQMGNSAAVKFWRANKDWLLAAAKANGRGVGAEKAA